MRLIERIWAGDSASDKVARAILSPFGVLYHGATAVRSWLYDSGVLNAEASAIPVVSVGNLTVGGTGKTPVSAWIAGRLAQRGRSPAIVLRGYGGDEPLVHSRLNPGIPVVVAAERASGVREAVANGADVAILDDAFQHRKASRDIDVVLVSADDWSGARRLLPTGPFREPMSALRRASAVFITSKSATEAQVESARAAVAREAPGVPVAVLRLELSELRRETPPTESIPTAGLAGKTTLAVAAIGNPTAFFRQLQALDAVVVPMAYPDHHPYSARDIELISAKSAGCDYVVCTLKDAVKLGPAWPATKTPLWYVSLAVQVESGEAAIDDLIMRL